jgi:hypothetical protein
VLALAALALEQPMAKRTTHRSTAGKKLYAVRDSKGQITDIQTFERSHAADIARTSKAETSAKRSAARKAAKPAAKKAVKKPATKAVKKPARKAARRKK